MLHHKSRPNDSTKIKIKFKKSNSLVREIFLELQQSFIKPLKGNSNFGGMKEKTLILRSSHRLFDVRTNMYDVKK